MGSGDQAKCIVLFDSQERVIKVSQQLLDALLIGEERRSKLQWQDMVVEDASKFIPDAEGETLDRIGYLKRSDGEIVEASFSCEIIGHSEKLVCAEVVLLESSVQKGPESVDKESLDFLTTVSHELRVALNGVIGFANVLGESKLTPDQFGILDKLRSCNLILMGLINDILEFSRVVSSKVDLSVEPVHLGEFLNDVAELFRERVRAKGLELKVEVEEAGDVTVEMPRLRVTQVLNNLMANAIKFTEHGWVKLSLEMRDDSCCIGVQDTGPGILESENESVFRPFFQSTESGFASEGSGLGLAISRELVEQMGGKLELRQPEKGGSLFQITLPLLRSEELASQTRKEDGEGTPSKVSHQEGASKPSEKPKRVLVVEDNQLNADILGHFLEDYGVVFDHVDNGKAAVEAYEDGKYDLILMDVMLPELNGYQATEKILSISRKSPQVPIIGVTAKVFRRDHVRCIEAGMAEVVHKPVDFKQLREVLDLYLYAENGDRIVPFESPKLAEAESVKGPPWEVSDFRVERDTVVQSSSGCLDEKTLEAYIDRMLTPDTSRREVVAIALEIVDLEVAELLKAIEGNDRKDIGMRAHSLKGALALLGARNILDLAKGLELIAGDGRTPLKAGHWREMIEQSYAEFKRELDAYMGTSVVE